jgi:hypothetical protein
MSYRALKAILSKTSFQQNFVKFGVRFKFVVACYSISYQLQPHLMPFDIGQLLIICGLSFRFPGCGDTFAVIQFVCWTS